MSVQAAAKVYTTAGAIVVECPTCKFNILVRTAGDVTCPKCQPVTS
jgi:uncharacterized Zn finger protein (UPF0148 family)